MRAVLQFWLGRLIEKKAPAAKVLLPAGAEVQ
jgi:hypothetical protein